MRIIILNFFFFILFFNFSYSQKFISADPFKILSIEKNILLDTTQSHNFIIRPIINKSYNNKLSILFRSESFFNDGAPNFENMGNKYIGKGIGFFNSINFSYFGKYLIFNVEPFYLYNQNIRINIEGRDGIFSRLNDVGYNDNSPYRSVGIRESQIYLHYNFLGVGLSNANMWWGPGIHNSLTMTNNTTGFPHLMIGTLEEKRVKNIGINFRYIFSSLDKTIGNPYFTSIVGTLRFYTRPIVTIGLSRNYISGGLPTDRPFTQTDAALLVFENLLIDTKIKEYPSEWPAHDPWDQVMSGFFILDFPASNLKLYMELGTNDHRQNWSDLRSHPDHAAASIIGFRKYEIFNIKSLLAGLEYTNLILSKTWKFRETPNWFNRGEYDYSSYDGRRWAAHSGSDSDDLFIYFGYQNDKWYFIPSLNYERHGVLYSRPPEVKMEVRLDFRFVWKNYRINIFYEREWLEHAGFQSNTWRNGNVIWFGIERDITNMLSNN